MARPTITIPQPDNVRKIRGSFSWIDHRLIRDGHLEKLSRDEFALYSFLVLVGDQHGVSFYRLEKICRYLGDLDWGDLHRARQGLIDDGLIAFQPFSTHEPNGFYQVLPLENLQRGD